MKEVIVGIATGIISSFIVTVIWHVVTKKMIERTNDKLNQVRYYTAFSQDIQLYCRYLDRLQMELDFPNFPDKNQAVLRVIESHPITHSFKYGLTSDGQSYLQKIYSIERSIENDVHENALDMILCKRYKSEIFQIECNMLKNQSSIRKPWDDYKRRSNIK